MPVTQRSVASAEREAQAKADAIIWIKLAIARNGISFDQLDAAGCFVVEDLAGNGHNKKRYIDAAGHAWDGIGDVPEWLQRAINAGQDKEHFRVA